MPIINSAQRPIFSGLRFFNEPEMSDSGPRRICAQDFYVLKKIHRTLDLEESTLPRDHRGRPAFILNTQLL